MPYCAPGDATDLGMYETRDGAKSVSLETEVFAQRYTLIVVDATVGLATHHNDRLCIMFSACPPDCACVRACLAQTQTDILRSCWRRLL